jgi:excisionase family DNA binding protein
MKKDEQLIDVKLDWEPMWTVSDVCKMFNLKPGTVRYWCHVHAITFHKLGALVRFRPSEVKMDFENGRLGRIGSCKKMV